MGVGLGLFQVDHANVVVRGLPALNHAIRTGDLSVLRALLGVLPFDDAKDQADELSQRLRRLREVAAPVAIIEVAERQLARVFRPTAEAIERATLEDLRGLLARWCPEPRTVDLDASWDLLHWYCDPGRRGRVVDDWRRAGMQPSPFDHAFHGALPHPLDASGRPVIHTGGDPASSWYTPPEVVAGIAEAIAGVLVSDWAAIDKQLDSAPEDCQPVLASCPDRLEYASANFERVAWCYQEAARRGFG
jgi:hypothetical protein